MRILSAPDKFKGSLTAEQAAEALAQGWRSVWPECQFELGPVADGGDGTLEVLQRATGAEWQRTSAREARGRDGQVAWLWEKESATAFIETARTIGLAPLATPERMPLTATSAGLGDLISTASDRGARKFYLGLGGSATNDAGCGMAAALGFRFLDETGTPFDPLPLHLHRLHAIESPEQTIAGEFIGLTDVQNPLLGPQGATRVYGPQKGAGADDILRLEQALARVADIAARDLGAPDPQTPGAGAAGGLGYGVMTFLGGALAPGFDTLAQLTHLEAAIARADLVLTGEGSLDAQTAHGKAPAGVAALAARHGKPVIAFAGSVPLTKVEGFTAVFPITNQPMTLTESMQQAAPLLAQAAARVARLLKVASSL